MNRQFTISARGKAAAVPIQMFMKRYFSDIPVAQIDSFFGFTTDKSTLYGGRIHAGTEISAYDLKSMYGMGIGLALPFGLRRRNTVPIPAFQVLFRISGDAGLALLATIEPFLP